MTSWPPSMPKQWSGGNWKAAKPTERGEEARPVSPAPSRERIDIDDATMEVLPLILADNPRGLVMVRDELSALVLGLNQYKGGKGGTGRSNALKIWSGDKIVKDRVNHENGIPIRCPHPMLTIVGGLTPDMLGELADPRGRADGFIDRFLLAYPDPLPVADWSGRGIPEDVADDWRSLIARLWMRELDVKDGRSMPHVAYFTPEGEARWEERYNAHSAEMNDPGFPPSLRGPWGKLREYAGRLTLILTLMRPDRRSAVGAESRPPARQGRLAIGRLLQEPCPPDTGRHRMRPRDGGDASVKGDRRLDSGRTTIVVH